MRPIKQAALAAIGLVLAAPVVAQDEDWDALFGDQPEAESAAPKPTPQPDNAQGQPQRSTPAIALPEPTRQPLPARAAPRVLEEIVVTAQKTSQSIQKVPVSVSAIDANTLKESGTFDAGGVENFVPNVEIDIDPQAPVIGIRGFATETDNVGFEPAVGLQMDDLALARPEFIPDGMFDIERVEVLRGPQGTLFGKNTIAGVITFATVEPVEAHEGSLMASFGDPGSRRLEAATTVPLADSLLLRGAGVYWDQQGDVSNTLLERTEGDFTQQAGRVKLGWDSGNDWDLRWSSQLSKTEVDYAPWQLYDAPEAVLEYNRAYDEQVESDPFDAQTSFNIPGYVNRDSQLHRAMLNADLGGVAGLDDLVSTTIVGQAGFDLATIIDIDVSPADLLVTDFATDFSQSSVESRIAGSSGSLFGWGAGTEFVAGVYAYQSSLNSRLDTLAGEDLAAFVPSAPGLIVLGAPEQLEALQPLLSLLPTVLGLPLEDELHRHFEQDTQSYALFGQMTWILDDRWSVLAGLRLGQETKEGRFNVYTAGDGLDIIATILGAEPYTAQRKRDESDISPKLGVLYAWNDDINSFASYTRGFKGGGFNATAESEFDEDGNDNLVFEPERASSIEAGVKSTLFDGSLRLNLTVYRTDIDDLQVVDFVNSSFQVSNAGSARLQGFEAEISWLPPWPWLSVDASLGLGKATYLDYANAEATQEQRANGQSSQDLTGKTLPNAPEFSAAVIPTVSLPLPFGDGLGLRWSLDASYRGDQYSAADLDAHSFQKAYWLLGTRFVLGPASEEWAVIFSGNNLTDERVLDLVMDHSLYYDTYINQQIPLRSFGVSLLANF